jgi:hypothetical protein
VYYYYSPPIILLVAGLLASLTSGLAFDATLKMAVREWSKNKSTRTLAEARGLSLLLPFLGICGGISFFLSAGLQIFGFPLALSIGIALPLTLLSGGLVWFQLGRVLQQIEEGGSAALDLDSFT